MQAASARSSKQPSGRLRTRDSARFAHFYTHLHHRRNGTATLRFTFFLTTFDLTNGQKAFVILLPLKTATFHVPGAMNATC